MQKETRVYLINIEKIEDVKKIKHYDEYSNEEFMEIAEEQGTVYTLEGFAKVLNIDEINTDDYFVRFIEVKIDDKENEILRNLILQEMSNIRNFNGNILSRMNTDSYVAELKNIYDKLV